MAELSDITSELCNIVEKRSNTDKSFQGLRDGKYSEYLLTKFSSYRESELLCDFTLRVDNKVFKVHRLILASSSDYFRALFSHGMVESKGDNLELNTVTSTATELLLEYAYTGRMSLTMQQLPDVIAAASFLQMTTAIKYCLNIMKSNMAYDVADCFVKLCEMFGLTEFKEFRRKYVLETFERFCESPEFLALDGETLASYLASDELNITTEGKLLKRVLAWYNHDPAKREPQAFNVFEKVRYVMEGWPVIDHAIKQDVFKKNPELVKHMIWCHDYMYNASKRYLYDDHRTRVRSTQRTLIHLGGIISDESLNMDYVLLRCRNYFYQRAQEEWCFLNGNTCTPRRSNAPMLQINDYAVVFGGLTHDDYVDDDFIPNLRYRKDVKHIGGSGFNMWDMPKMSVERGDHVAVHIPGYVYIIGGRNENGPLSSVERLTMLTEQWELVQGLDQVIYCHAGAAHSDLVFICGGLQSQQVTDRLQCYRAAEDRWEDRAPLLTARYGHTMTNIGNRLVVCGGRTDGAGAECLSSVEVYDPEVDQWSFLSPMIMECCHHSATTLDGKLLIAGGSSCSGEMLDAIQEYHPQLDEWRHFGTLRYPTQNFLFCSILVNPRYTGFDDDDADSLAEEYERGFEEIGEGDHYPVAEPDDVYEPF